MGWLRLTHSSAPRGKSDFALMCACSVGCIIVPQGSDAEPPSYAVDTGPVRDVRVQIISEARRVRVRSKSSVRLLGGDGTSLGQHDLDDWVVVSPTTGGGVLFGGRVRGRPPFTLIPSGPEVIEFSAFRDGDWSQPNHYPGQLRVTVGDGGSIAVVNVVDVERYVACVVGNEVWPTFETEAFRAQAIAARTFVLYQMKRRNGSAFDVAAGQAAQVYRGVRTDGVGRRADGAAEHTRGIVCTWHDGERDRLFSTYYSAACGGMSQSAGIFGAGDDIAPLAGGVRCDYCRIAPGDTYRWGPVRLTKRELRARLVSAYPDLKSLGGIRRVRVVEETSSGRPVRLRLSGSRGAPHDMLAERFRLAVGGNVLRSTDFRIHDREGEITFEQGRGFGHGLGLCQWGMQGQAVEGRSAGEILRYYYPGSKLTRAY